MARTERQNADDGKYSTKPTWRPAGSNGSSRLVTCRNGNCGNEHVDPRFARVFGDERGNVFACPDCTPWMELRRGAAADPEFEPPRDVLPSGRGRP